MSDVPVALRIDFPAEPVWMVLLQCPVLVAGVGVAVTAEQLGHPLLQVAPGCLLPAVLALTEQAAGGEPGHRLGMRGVRGHASANQLLLLVELRSGPTFRTRAMRLGVPLSIHYGPCRRGSSAPRSTPPSTCAP